MMHLLERIPELLHLRMEPDSRVVPDLQVVPDSQAVPDLAPVLWMYRIACLQVEEAEGTGLRDFQTRDRETKINESQKRNKNFQIFY